MDRTVVLITGCSSGIGLHLATRLASDPSRSFKVYATFRDLSTQGPLWEAAESRGCPPGSLETLQLDVQDADSVAAARARVTEGCVDVLGEPPQNACQSLPCPVSKPRCPEAQGASGVPQGQRAVREARGDRPLLAVCNAGRGLLGPLEVHSADAVGSVLDVNLVGTVRVLQAFLPDMKRRHSGRILVTGSMGGLMGEWKGPGGVRGTRGAVHGCAPSASQRPHLPSKGIPFNDVYCASKFAIEGLCESLAIQLLPFGVHVSLIECGPVRTAFQEKFQMGRGVVLDNVDAQTRNLFSQYLRHSKQVFREQGQDPEEVAEVFLTAMRDPRPALRYFSSEGILPLVRLRLSDPSGCSYVAAMHRIGFSDKPAHGPDGAGTEAGAGTGGP
ncbi:estradiol 17-beta-dehydrogenase 1 isoform X1 [Phyllostomus discolor]|uniref:Estradiol 17-beta-dehydrogenase 1 isoform X1 n=1 Tax=Phyllostomus discolor TaxID=89673 RepID=A0A7E6EFK0_9CHIR|nr:estradiol 17-beta-dehydrogenase 1 isoform X1 [Phyllostomus discolor]